MKSYYVFTVYLNILKKLFWIPRKENLISSLSFTKKYMKYICNKIIYNAQRIINY